MKKHNPLIFFPNLDGLRFFCFLSVFLYHSWATQHLQIQQNHLYSFVKYRLFGNGNLGVNFFFVLSGFLITYLLLAEKTEFRKIRIGKFYLRRVLRIWPLFYFCVFFGFILFPLFKHLLGYPGTETASPVLYLTFLSNFDTIFKGTPDSSVLNVLWSVSIEEQFYLVWPLIVGFSKKEWLPFIFATIITGSFIFRVYNSHNYFKLELHTISCISDMTVGAAGAYLSFFKTKFYDAIKKLSRLKLVLLYLSVLTVYIFRKELFGGSGIFLGLDRLLISFIFLMVILEQNFCQNSLFKMGKFKKISTLGKITYGLYCLHMIGILIAAVFLTKVHLNAHLWQLLLIEGPLSFLIAIALAQFSFHFFEKKFLELKKKFEFVKTEEK